MFDFLKSSLPDTNDFDIKSYKADFSLSRLKQGVDNIRYDVRLSPKFCREISKMTLRLFAKHCQIENLVRSGKTPHWASEKNEFKKIIKDVLIDAIDKAKAFREIQIDFVAQTAIVKIFKKELHNQYEILIGLINKAIQKYDSSSNISHLSNENATVREKLLNILKNKHAITNEVSAELFQYLNDVQCNDLKEIRESIFGTDSMLPADFFFNPIMYTGSPYDNFVMVEHYVLMGSRLDDRIKYDTALFLLRQFFSAIDAIEQQQGKKTISYNLKIDSWIKYIGNVNILFDYFQSNYLYKSLKEKNENNAELLKLEIRAKKQKKLLNFCYKQFKKYGLIESIAASYEIYDIYLEYCPPLVPLQILNFLIDSKTRKNVLDKLQRSQQIYSRQFSVKPLWKTVSNLNRAGSKKKKEYLIKFIEDFARHYRDFQNFNALKQGLESLNMIEKEKTINLSRLNNTLYEFLLPHEHVDEEKPIINHVIIKADVRGSTDITHKMHEKGLNPASHFGINFFDPISNILSEYGAVKVFIEGDAVILSIFEREGAPKGWYGVARSCGLALNMLSIVQTYNARSKKYKLPLIELGIGVVYRDSSPTFLFDGDDKIMISSAINLADRLSGCAKTLRKLASQKLPFNLYVFQTVSEKDISATSDNLFLRYNVNGIELNAEGFEKLSKEIDLQEIEYDIPNAQEEKTKIYIGKFPTATGRYQQLMIREAHILEVFPDDMSVKKLTPRKYYEVFANTTS